VHLTKEGDVTDLLDNEILPANERYAVEHGDHKKPMPPARKFAVVTCMDARLDPARFLGLEEGDAHVIRNAGGIVTDDALRSLVISHNLLGTEQVLVIGHTDCGMLTFKDEDVQAQLDTDIVLHAFPDLEARIRESVRVVSESPLLPDAVSGFVYEVETGRLRPVT
jgi:carbonic anhydrase